MPDFQRNSAKGKVISANTPQSYWPVNRLETLADGIFAIAMTILILEFKVPEWEHANSAQLTEFLISLWPKALCYVLSFIHLGVFWIGHHTQFLFIKRANRILIFYNILYLMLIAFIPFATAFVGTYWNQKAAVLLYGGNVLAACAALYYHWIYAVENKLSEVPEKPLVALLGARILRGMAFYALTMAFVFAPGFQPVWALPLYAAIPFLYLKPARIDKHFKKRGDS